MDFKTQRDSENQEFINSLLKRNPAIKENLLRLGLIDECGNVVKGVFIPHLEFEAHDFHFTKEKESHIKLHLDNGSGEKLKQERQLSEQQRIRIDDLKETVVDLAVHQAKTNAIKRHHTNEPVSPESHVKAFQSVPKSESIDPIKAWEKAIAEALNMVERQTLYAMLKRSQGKTWKEIGNHFGKNVRTAKRWLEMGKGEALRIKKGLPKI